MLKTKFSSILKFHLLVLLNKQKILLWCTVHLKRQIVEVEGIESSLPVGELEIVCG